MGTAKIAISLDPKVVTRLDRLVKAGLFRSRSSAVQDALQERLARLDRGRLSRECAKLDAASEKAMAEEGFQAGAETWPEY
jgi:Arc/MetJ-type ribon-helix-helix transcriptional regulator